MRTVDHRVIASGLLTAVCTLFMTLIVVGNITDFGTNQAFVVGVLEMDTTFRDPDLMWRAIDSSTLQNIGYVFVIACEAATAALLLVGLWKLWGVRSRGDTTPAVRWITYGTLGVVAVFGIGFTGVGGEWFSMWQSTQWNGLEPALRYYLFAVTTLIYVTIALRQVAEDRRQAPDRLETSGSTTTSARGDDVGTRTG